MATEFDTIAWLDDLCNGEYKPRKIFISKCPVKDRGLEEKEFRNACGYQLYPPRALASPERPMRQMRVSLLGRDDVS